MTQLSEVFIRTLRVEPSTLGLSCGPSSLLPITSRVSPPSLREQQLDPPQKDRLGAALSEMDQQLRKLADTPWLCQLMEPSDEEVCGPWGSAWALLGAVALPWVPVFSVPCVASELTWCQSCSP